jgi:acetate kinase
MKILVLNSGSSSIKYQLIEMPKAKILAKGIVERIGLSEGVIKHQIEGHEKKMFEMAIPDHNVGISEVLKLITDLENGCIRNFEEIGAVGHRVVHGGEDFSGSVLIDEVVLQSLRDNSVLAPLHNPANIQGIEAIAKLLPTVPQIGVFDTAFHQSIPEYAYLYALPYSYYKDLKIRRYGFHGTSHRYVSAQAADFLNKDITELKLISCHLGNGSSVAAIQNGKSIDTSMGLTPNEGLIMGTRTGDIDAGIIQYIMENQKMTPQELNQLINKKSGLMGISGISSDMRELEKEAENGNKRAILALEMFVYRLLKYVGAYTFVMGGVDAIIFTGGIGENSDYIRGKIMSAMKFWGLQFSSELNKKTRSTLTLLTTDDSKIKVMVVPTDEELVIAMDTYSIVY